MTQPLEPLAPPGRNRRAEPLPASADLDGFLLQLLRPVLAEPAPERLVETALDGLIELSGAERGMIAVFDDGGNPRFQAARELEAGDLDRPELEVSRSLLERTRTSGEPFWAVNALDDPSLGDRQSVLRLRILSVICLPILHDGEVFGVIYLDNRTASGVFSEHTAGVAERFAELISLAVWNALERDRLGRQVRELSANRRRAPGFDRIVTADPAMEAALELAAQVAPSPVPVLIQGDSGTGKELIARAVHETSGRRGELVAVNCAALPEALLETELFGHRRGAFTGAVRDNPGFFARARGGTLFLDEVGELSPACQAKLLRVLESGEYTPVGDGRTRLTDARVVAASNRDLRSLVDDGRMREDLYFRLAVVEVRVPPLRERPDDVLLLARHLLDRDLVAGGRPGAGDDARPRRLGRAAERVLLRHDWPGNVRELRNALQRAALVAPGESIEPGDLPESVRRTAAATELCAGAAAGLEAGLEFREAKRRAVESFERSYVARALESSRGNISAAARAAGIDYKNFYTKMKSYGIDPARFKS